MLRIHVLTWYVTHLNVLNLLYTANISPFQKLLYRRGKTVSLTLNFYMVVFLISFDDIKTNMYKENVFKRYVCYNIVFYFKLYGKDGEWNRCFCFQINVSKSCFWLSICRLWMFDFGNMRFWTCQKIFNFSVRSNCTKVYSYLIEKHMEK